MTVDRAVTHVAFCILLVSSCRSNYSRQVAGGPYPKLERHSPISVLGQAQDALTSERFTGAVKVRNVVLITYRELIAKQGLKAMRRPAG